MSFIYIQSLSSTLALSIFSNSIVIFVENKIYCSKEGASHRYIRPFYYSAVHLLALFIFFYYKYYAGPPVRCYAPDFQSEK